MPGLKEFRRRPAVRARGVLDVPGHGGHRLPDVRAGAVQPVARWRGTLFDNRWLHGAALAMAPPGFVAMLCGWMTTEIGRQPYTVYGVLRTADSVSPIALPGDRHVAGGVRRGVFHRVRRRRAGHAAPDGQAARDRREPGSTDLPIRTAGIQPGLPGAVPRGAGAASPLPGGVAAMSRRDHRDHLGRADRLRRARLRRAGRVRPRRRHPVRRRAGRADRDAMVNTIAPMWDGNETWLVLGGGGLFGGVPAGLRDHPAGAVPDDPRHAARPDLPRRRVRVPLPRQTASGAGCGTSPSSAARPWRRCARG